MWRNRITNDKFKFDFTMWNLCKMGTSINYNLFNKDYRHAEGGYMFSRSTKARFEKYNHHA